MYVHLTSIFNADSMQNIPGIPGPRQCQSHLQNHLGDLPKDGSQPRCQSQGGVYLSITISQCAPPGTNTQPTDENAFLWMKGVEDRDVLLLGEACLHRLLSSQWTRGSRR
jgi:hypothetical protein